MKTKSAAVRVGRGAEGKTNHSQSKMKTNLLQRGVCCAAIVGTLLMQPAKSSAQVDVFDVNLQSAQFTLYTDPYNGNEIKVGGFSGIYPVPGKPDSFYVITDRGPAPDF